MKILKYFLGLLAAMILAFIVFGYIMPVADYRVEESIALPVEPVFDYVRDISRWTEWQEGVVQVEPLSDDSLRVGSQYRLVVNDGEYQVELKLTVLGIRPHRIIRYRLESDRLVGDVEMNFQESGNATVVRWEGEFRGKGLIWRSVVPFMRRALTRQAQQDLEMLKHKLEYHWEVGEE
jgi:hypothetical protein